MKPIKVGNLKIKVEMKPDWVEMNPLNQNLVDSSSFEVDDKLKKNWDLFGGG